LNLQPRLRACGIERRAVPIGEPEAIDLAPEAVALSFGALRSIKTLVKALAELLSVLLNAFLVVVLPSYHPRQRGAGHLAIGLAVYCVRTVPRLPVVR